LRHGKDAREYQIPIALLAVSPGWTAFKPDDSKPSGSANLSAWHARTARLGRMRLG
jgi:hypothetical protein